jgi:tetratricopeptide (TPR) repeat protein
MAIEGSLADVSLADISQLLSLGRKTGCLTVTDRSNFGYIYFEKGRVVYASVLNRPDRLGEILVKNGVIQEEDFSRAMEEQGQDGQKRLGELLVGSGVLSEEDLQKWVTLQVEEAVFHLFSWDQGTFHFKPDELPDQVQMLLVSLSSDSLLLEGARRVDEWTLIEKEISSLDLVFQLVRDPLEAEDVELTRNQKKIVPLLDGERTVREVVEDSGLVEFETGKAIFELVRAGFAQSVGEKTEVPAGEDDKALQGHVRLGLAFYQAGMFEDAEKEFLQALSMDSSEPRALFRLGLIEMKGGSAERALGHFDAMPTNWSHQVPVLRNRALALENLGRFEEALVALRKAHEVDPTNSHVILAKAISELKAGDPKSARATFVSYRNRVGKGRPPALYYAFAVLAAAAAGRQDEAVNLGREGLKEYPTEATILVNTGAILDHKGNHEAAEQYFMRALRSGSDVPPQAHKNLGDQAFRRGDTKAAQAQYEKAVRLDPSLGDDVFLRLGMIAAEVGDTELAILFLRRAIELNSKNEEARARLADLSEVP